MRYDIPRCTAGLVVRASLLRSSVDCSGSIGCSTACCCCSFFEDWDRSRSGKEEHKRQESLEFKHDDDCYKSVQYRLNISAEEK